MTSNINIFEKAASALQGRVRGVGFKEGVKAVNLAAEFRMRGVDFQNDASQFEK